MKRQNVKANGQNVKAKPKNEKAERQNVKGKRQNEEGKNEIERMEWKGEPESRKAGWQKWNGNNGRMGMQRGRIMPPL